MFQISENQKYIVYTVFLRDEEGVGKMSPRQSSYIQKALTIRDIFKVNCPMIFKYFACRVIIIVLSFAFLLKFSRLIWNAFQIETAYYLWNFGFVQIQKFSTFAISFSTDNTQKFFFLIYSTSEKVSHWKIDFVQKFLLFKVLSYLVKNYRQKKQFD